MVASLIYKQHCSLRCFPFLSKNSQQYESHVHRIRSLRKKETDPCHSTVFCDPEIISLIDRDSGRSICFCGRQFRKMKSLPFDKFHFRADVVNYIWLNDVPSTFDYFDISNKIRRYKYRFRYTVPVKWGKKLFHIVVSDIWKNYEIATKLFSINANHLKIMNQTTNKNHSLVDKVQNTMALSDVVPIQSFRYFSFE